MAVRHSRFGQYIMLQPVSIGRIGSRHQRHLSDLLLQIQREDRHTQSHTNRGELAANACRKMPTSITFYFPQVDHEGHAHGPDSKEVENAVDLIDSSVYELNKAVTATGLNGFVFVSDHGTTAPDIDHGLPLPSAIDTSKYIISGDGILVELYARSSTPFKRPMRT